MATNKEIITQFANADRLQDMDNPDQVREAMLALMDKARDEGYKEGYKAALIYAHIDTIKQLAALIIKSLEGVDRPAANDDEGDD